MPHQATTGELSVLVVKPDGYRSPRVREYVDVLLDASPLSVELRYEVCLEDEDVLDTWPKFAGPKYPITAELLKLYLTSGPCEVIVVRGPEVVRRCAQLRAEVRARFGTSAFANCVHTPTEPHEIGPNVEKYLVSLPTGRPFVRHLDEGATVGITGRLAAVPRSVLLSEARAFWRTAQEDGWRAAWRGRPAGGAYGTCLLPGDPHSVDHGMSLIADALPGLTPREVISAYVEAEVEGWSCLLSGTREQARDLAALLTAQGLYTEVRAMAAA
ncbi:hypothetical protein ACFY0F_06580 [Streptomyces sp. NPDC001544]|uniref:hypothetical protein n=1 Tax=Streptomyces sp. NPDC001544 TaxID=3364584 RepID=UPI003674D14F